MLLIKFTTVKIYNNKGLVESARLVTEILSEDKVAQQQMSAVGFGAVQQQEGNKFLQNAEASIKTRTQLKQERWALSKQIGAGRGAAIDQFRHYAKAARFALEDNPELLHALQIDRINQSTWGVVDQAIFFYQQLQEHKVSLDAFGIGAKDVQDALKTATNLLRQRKERIRRKAMVQQNTQDVRQATAALRQWMIEFRANARLAYRQQPQMLEMFGIRVKAPV